MPRLIVVLIVGMMLSWGPMLLQAQAPDSLQPYSRQTLQLDERTPSLEFAFQANSESVWSFSVERSTGDLDPVLRLYDDAGTLLAANDNETRQSPTARLEGWVAPQAGRYRLEVSREGASAGQAILTVTGDGDSIPLSPLPIPGSIALAPGQVTELARLGNRDYQRVTAQFSARLRGQEALGLQLWSGAFNGLDSWLLVIGRAGVTLQSTAQDEDGNLSERVLIDLDQRLEVGDYRIEVSAQTLSLSINGSEAVRLESANLGRFIFLRPTYPSLRLLALPNNASPLTLTTPYASTPFYHDQQPLSEALPPAPPQGRLYAYGEVPLVVMRELRAAGFAPEGGGLAFSVPEGLLETSEVGFSTYPLTMAEGLQDQVIAFWTLLRNGDPSTACGLNLRQRDSANFSAALIAADSSAYILSYQDGALSDDSLAVSTPWITPGLGQENHVLIVAQGETLTLFVNGYWVGQTSIPQAVGTVWLEMVVNQAVTSRCFYRNLWVWDLGQD
jgi:hypothetical protein